MDERSESMVFSGQYKVRGGKLVSVDVTVSEDRIATAHVFGDFFLEPDDALEDLNAALVGMPTSATAAELSAAITARLDARPDPVQMIGFDAEAVAISVRRALGHATSWEDLTFEVFDPVVLPPVMHVALDEVLPNEVLAGRRGPHFRIWDWDSSLVVIGSYQSLRNEIDADGAAKHGIDVVRRITGGGVLLHHVTMAYDIDADTMGEVLRIGREKLSDKGTRSANKRVDPMRSQTGLARQQIIDGFLEFFRARYDTATSTYTEDELAKARKLVETKFGTEEWTSRVP